MLIQRRANHERGKTVVVARGRLLPASTDAPSDGVELLVSTRVQELVFFRTHIAFGGLFLCATTQMCDQILFLGSNVERFFLCVRKDEKEKEGQNREEEEERERPRRRSREEETLKKCCTSVVVSWYFSYI